MDKILSQEEINALFSSMSSENPDPGGERKQHFLPRRTVERDFHRADPNSQDPARGIRMPKTACSEAERMLELIRQMPISLSGEMRGSSLTVEDLLRISIGDVIELKERIGDPASLCVGGVAKFLGSIVQRRRKMAFEISGTVSKRSESREDSNG